MRLVYYFFIICYNFKMEGVILVNKVLSIKNLTKKYKNRIAVDDVTFDIYEGEIFGLLGPNGAGKTTIIKMITGLSSASKGEVLICGKSITKNFEKAIVNVGAIIESPTLYPYMTGKQNLKYYASLYKGIPKTRIDEVVEVVGLKDRINDKVKTYSLGMKQRLGIAQAILHNPKILILDEPTNGLDPNGILEMRNFIKKIAKEQKISVLVSSHILSEMEAMCNTVAIIDKGKLKQVRSVSSLKTANAKSRIAIKVNYPNYVGKLIINQFGFKCDVAGQNVVVEIEEKDIPMVTSFLISKKVPIFGIMQVNKTLEQMFLDIVNNNN